MAVPARTGGSGRLGAEQAVDRLFEEPALAGQGLWGEGVVAGGGDVAQRRGVDEIGKHQAEQAEGQVGQILRAPARIGGTGADDREALPINRTDPAGEQGVQTARFFEQRTLQEAAEVGVLSEVAEYAVERRPHTFRFECSRRPRIDQDVDERTQAAFEHGIVERLLAGEVVVKAGRGQIEVMRQIAHGHAIDAAGGEKLLGGVENDFAGRLRRGIHAAATPWSGAFGHGVGVLSDPEGGVKASPIRRTAPRRVSIPRRGAFAATLGYTGATPGWAGGRAWFGLAPGRCAAPVTARRAMRRFPMIAIVCLLVMASVAVADTPVATVGGQPIGQAAVEAKVRPRLIEIDAQRYEALREGVDALIAENVLQQEAKARGVTVEVLERDEIVKKAGDPTDAEIKEVFEANREALGEMPLDQARPHIVEFVRQQKGQARREAYIGELRTKYKAVVLLKPPVVQVGTAGRPARGGANAPVVIVGFSDYECPYCKSAEGTVEQVMKAYGDKVRYVHRDFPLAFHQHAFEAAEAAACANAQGKFWEYHAKLFAASDLSTEKLKTMAGEVGLDRKKFDECLASNQFKAAVEKDMADAAEVGVSGTPAFFINGRMLSGAQPFERFKEVIDEELAASSAAKPS